ncbi:MAG: DUF711 family protein [Anaerolineae bacterium]|nr:DUF711 family protein [Anaerolineae bacterium]
MEIRSVTVFTNLSHEEPEIALAQAANFLHSAIPAFQEAGYRVQSRRVATQPFPHILDIPGPLMASNLASRVQQLAKDYGIDYLSLGPAGLMDAPGFTDVIPEMLAATESIFLGVDIAEPGEGIDLALIQKTAKIIQAVSTQSPDGLSNLFLAALANVGPGAPFFPAAYHKTGAPPGFALAIEAADIAVTAFERAKWLIAAEDDLTRWMNSIGRRVSAVANRLAEEFDLEFYGLDLSLAPYPNDETSLGAAFEQLGVTIGGGGSAAAAGVIMTAMDNANFRRTGFNGLMLPVLEDSVLARRASSGELTTTDLLLYSAICGTGLDTIPLPGDISVESLSGLLLDTAALALRLDKPLTARLMPLPGKAAGDDTGLEGFEYFAPAKVMAAPQGIKPGSMLSSDEIYEIKPRRPRD